MDDYSRRESMVFIIVIYTFCIQNSVKMDLDTKVNLITRNLQEVIGLDVLKKIVAVRPLKIYLGTAVTGKPHIGYLLQLLKIVDYLRAGCEVTVLFADLHAMLDSLKTTPGLIEARTEYYTKIIKSTLRALGADIEQIKFVKGSDYQLTPEYTKDVYRFITHASIHDARKAGSEVVKQSENPKLGDLMYPVLQALDEEYLGVDCQTGGVDQKKIFVFAADYLPNIGYKKRIHLMTPMLKAIDAKCVSIVSDSEGTEIVELDQDNENIQDTKMSSSNLNSKIDLLDTKNEVKKKINRAYCLEGDVSFNPLMELVKLVLFPLLENQGIECFTIDRPVEFGGTLKYTDYNTLEKDFVEKLLHPQDLKLAVSSVLNNFLDKIRVDFADKESQKLLKKAYPAGK